MNEKLIELADRCEAATGPDREMDAAIARETGCIPRSAKYEGTLKMGDLAWSNWCGYVIPSYSSSIDAAMTLVPEGYSFDLFTLGDRYIARVFSRKAKSEGAEPRAAIPALALCAAALRARATLEDNHETR